MSTNNHFKSRTENDVWTDLKRLCTSPGYIHALSYLCFENNFIKYSIQGISHHDLEKMRSTDRLLRSELSLIMRLMVEEIHFEIVSPDQIHEYIRKTISLLSELHEALVEPLRHIIEAAHQKKQTLSLLNANGLGMRESVFYASESAYTFQYVNFSSIRYSRDQDWLLANKGFISNDVKIFINTVLNIQNERLGFIGPFLSFKKRTLPSLLPFFTYSCTEISKKSTLSYETTKSILNAFSCSEDYKTQSFNQIGDFNSMDYYPFINIGNDSSVLLQDYNLLESAYEAPSFWMGQDPSYASTYQKNRGLFTEEFSADRLKSVFGAENVHQNIYVMKGKDRIGEIDVLVTYADRAIVLQAKSKKLTQEAKKGNEFAIKSDFKKAIQEAYDQGYKCSYHFDDSSCKITDEKGIELSLRRDFSEIFIFCVVSDRYQALSLQSLEFLSKHQHDKIRNPYVIDIFFLDILCEILETPLFFFDYLHKRLKNIRISSETEYAILSYHITRNHWIDQEDTIILVESSLATYLDAAMLVRRDGLAGNRTPSGILNRSPNSFYNQIICYIQSAELDSIIDLGYIILSFSDESITKLSEGKKAILKKTHEDGKAHNFIIGFPGLGLIVYSSCLSVGESISLLYSHCNSKKKQMGLIDGLGYPLILQAAK